ncbi:LYR motif-containing protein 9 isoform X3, partial [Arapaima gigas]
RPQRACHHHWNQEFLCFPLCASFFIQTVSCFSGRSHVPQVDRQHGANRFRNRPGTFTFLFHKQYAWLMLTGDRLEVVR